MKAGESRRSNGSAPTSAYLTEIRARSHAKVSRLSHGNENATNTKKQFRKNGGSVGRRAFGTVSVRNQAPLPQSILASVSGYRYDFFVCGADSIRLISPKACLHGIFFSPKSIHLYIPDMPQKFSEMRYSLSYQPDWSTTWKEQPCTCSPAAYAGMCSFPK